MGDTPFNPYNPYIPGAMLGVDGPLLGTQPYYPVSPYPNSVSSSGYFPVFVQPGTDTVTSSATETMPNVAPSAMSRTNGSTAKRTHSSSPVAFSMNSSKAASSQTHARTGASQGSIISTGTSKRPMANRSNGSIGSVHGASSHAPQVCLNEVFVCLLCRDRKQLIVECQSFKKRIVVEMKMSIVRCILRTQRAFIVILSFRFFYIVQ